VPDGRRSAPGNHEGSREGIQQFRSCPPAGDGSPMTVRGGGVPTCFLASMPKWRMGPPPRSFAADAHDCIMAGSLDHRIQGCGAIDRARNAGSPLIVIPIAPSVPSRSKLQWCGLATASLSERVGATANLDSFCASQRQARCRSGRRNVALKSNKETDKRKKDAPTCRLLKRLLDKAHTRKRGRCARWRVQTHGIDGCRAECEHNFCDMARTLRMGKKHLSPPL